PHRHDEIDHGRNELERDLFERRHRAGDAALDLRDRPAHAFLAMERQRQRMQATRGRPHELELNPEPDFPEEPTLPERKNLSGRDDADEHEEWPGAFLK